MACSQPTSSCSQQDLVSSRSGLWLWGVPGVLLLVGILWTDARALLWTVAFLMGGAACVVNASRCGRAHCYFTGPLYLSLAVASALIGLGEISWDWWWVGAAFLGGTLLAYVPELFGKRYVLSTGR
jgi:hypothetical protein